MSHDTSKQITADALLVIRCFKKMYVKIILYIDFGRCCKWITSAPILKEEGMAWGLYNDTQYANTYIYTYV